MPNNSSRLHVVDALRGFAILSIMLLHNIEHFDFYYSPANLPDWMKALDKDVWNTLFFLFGGKSYAIFALLFGLTFWIQSAHQERKGRDFRGRFAWRLALLLLFGLVNSTFYQGDILMLYAVLGFSLLPVARLGNRAVFGIALVLLLQPFQWVQVFEGLRDPAMKMADPLSWSYFAKTSEYLSRGSVLNTWIGNLTTGRTAVILWTWENGRVLQTCALFMLGLLAGRLGLFAAGTAQLRLWRRVLVGSLIGFAATYPTVALLPRWIPSEAIRRPLTSIGSSWSNLAFMLVLVSGFVLLYQTRLLHGALDKLAPIGRMSLSNYIGQSLVGTTLYYGFGLGLYQYTGATYCLLIGAGLAAVQLVLSRWWLRNHQQGPLESLWHYATWLRSRPGKPAARTEPVVAA